MVIWTLSISVGAIRKWSDQHQILMCYIYISSDSFCEGNFLLLKNHAGQSFEAAIWILNFAIVSYYGQPVAHRR